MKQESIGVLLIKIAWWVRTAVLVIPITLLIGLASSLFKTEDIAGSVLFIGNLSGALSIYVLILVIGQAIAMFGLNQVLISKDWTIVFIALGAISVISVSGLMYVFGGVLCLRERQIRRQHYMSIKKEQHMSQNGKVRVKRVKRKRKVKKSS
ncbi:hypothetical protein ACWOAH_06025 [Vagococcus vulneris]|uniref:Uncharacterized protein n=1 Tax=Vagococcus vulneris TaxID=1977869 RepID=A0A429ZZ41_9ENTE|nr:hypothetical protein [Vagococcus vulneris]RST99278.1 hypothetical protein CBF37_04730 [Vagococcus vulneris]